MSDYSDPQQVDTTFDLFNEEHYKFLDIERTRKILHRILNSSTSTKKTNGMLNKPITSSPTHTRPTQRRQANSVSSTRVTVVLAPKFLSEPAL
ncbi:hypothetical protein H0G86_000255 [Trichoderma simmonsii]|uniref:Uncharacterized protein n=1 Tax=Trichoderma simmonsii TaxID=1491479 RepID=A0A8G0PB97_9HYPO|nr:hypothetical protein H0G86_000255 [Trichoderma simmonsii]